MSYSGFNNGLLSKCLGLEPATNMRENEDSQARLGMMTVTQALNKHNKQYKIIYLENCLTVENWQARLWQDICQGFLF